MEREEIIESLHEIREKMGVIIYNFRLLNSVGGQDERDAIRKINFTMWDMIDQLGDTETDIYNYFMGRK